MHDFHLAADAHHFVIDDRYFLVDGHYFAIDDRYFVIDDRYFVMNHRYSVIDAVDGLQTFDSCHVSFFLSQFIEPQQGILDFCLSHHPLHKLLWTTISKGRWPIVGINSLALLCLSSFVAMARIASTCTMIFTIVSIIPAVGVTSIYVSSR